MALRYWHKGTDPKAIEIAERLGLSFDGMMVDAYQFTVVEGPDEAKGITFYVTDLSRVESRLHEKLKEFGIENPGIKEPGMGEEEKWEALLRSIRKAAKILNIDLTEQDMPEYLNWKVGNKKHSDLWDQVYGREKVKGNPIKTECKNIAQTIPGILETVNHLQENYLAGQLPEVSKTLDSLSKHVNGMTKRGHIDMGTLTKAQSLIRGLDRDFSIAKSSELNDILFEGVLDKVIECECGEARIMAKAWAKAVSPLMYYTITDPGKTTFKIGEVVSSEALEKENERVIKLGEMPATGKIKE